MAKIVIVEDDVPIAAMYRLKLESNGYDVQVAHDGKHGLGLVKAFKPDVTLLDLRLPLMEGTEVLEHIRANAWGSNTRVIILTNTSKDEAPSKLRFFHVDRYVVKAHHTPSQVMDIVKDVLGEKRVSSNKKSVTI